MAMSPALRNKLLGMTGAGALAIAGTMIPDLEGVKYAPYYDVAGVLTVCYGHTGPDIKPGKNTVMQSAARCCKKTWCCLPNPSSAPLRFRRPNTRKPR
jgi:hypothetical protein